MIPHKKSPSRDAQFIDPMFEALNRYLTPGSAGHSWVKSVEGVQYSSSTSRIDAYKLKMRCSVLG
jgi:hypothetical protein